MAAAAAAPRADGTLDVTSGRCLADPQVTFRTFAVESVDGEVVVETQAGRRRAGRIRPGGRRGRGAERGRTAVGAAASAGPARLAVRRGRLGGAGAGEGRRARAGRARPPAAAGAGAGAEGSWFPRPVGRGSERKKEA
jgi:hypothetical protein